MLKYRASCPMKKQGGFAHLISLTLMNYNANNSSQSVTQRGAFGC